MIYYRLLHVLFFSLALGLVSQASFAAAPPITLNYPGGGETFVAGTLQQVELGPKPKVTPVNVELSLDGGATFTSLGSIAVVKSVAQPLSFTVPNTPSGNCVIRVSGTLKSGKVSAASRTFAIVSAGTTGTSGLTDGSVTNPKLAGLAVSNDKVTSGAASSDFVLTADGIGNAVWKTLPASGSNNGLAGGDLTGTYPNPSVALNAISADKLAPGVIPTALPPNGPAGGSLSGTYPNPSLSFAAGSIPASSVSSSPIFGDGSDLEVIISIDVTLARDMYYNNLTVNPGIVLNTGGFRIFVKGTCTLNGTIRNNGRDGPSGGPSLGLGAPSGTIGGGGHGNGSGGAGYSLVNSLGGNGGKGGSGTTSGGNGGLNTVPTALEGGVQVVNALPTALTCRVLSATLATGGAGGGGGGGGIVIGTGGGGGGVVMIAARGFSGTGSIQANGGSGSAGSVTAGGGGGGGGGGGCVVIVTTSALPASITTNVSGGAAGSGGATAAMAGAPGRVVVLY